MTPLPPQDVREAIPFLLESLERNGRAGRGSATLKGKGGSEARVRGFSEVRDRTGLIRHDNNGVKRLSGIPKLRLEEGQPVVTATDFCLNPLTSKQIDIVIDCNAASWRPICATP